MNPVNQVFRDFFEQNLHRQRLTPVREKQGSALRWVEVLELPHSHLTLGIAANGHWVICHSGQLTELVPGEYLVPLLPCLEIRAAVFFDHLRDGLFERELPEQWLTTFPTVSLLETALQSRFASGSGHWLRLGLEWCEQLGLSDAELNLDLQEIGESRDRRIPQSLRQRARHLAKRNFSTNASYAPAHTL